MAALGGSWTHFFGIHRRGGCPVGLGRKRPPLLPVVSWGDRFDNKTQHIRIIHLQHYTNLVKLEQVQSSSPLGLLLFPDLLIDTLVEPSHDNKDTTESALHQSSILHELA